MYTHIISLRQAKQRYISSRFPRSSEAFLSEFLEKILMKCFLGIICIICLQQVLVTITCITHREMKLFELLCYYFPRVHIGNVELFLIAQIILHSVHCFIEGFTCTRTSQIKADI